MVVCIEGRKWEEKEWGKEQNKKKKRKEKERKEKEKGKRKSKARKMRKISKKFWKNTKWWFINFSINLVWKVTRDT